MSDNFVTDPTAPAGDPVDTITHAFGGYDEYAEVMAGILAGFYSEVFDPVEGAYAFYYEAPELDVRKDKEDVEQTEFAQYENALHHGRVIAKPEGVDLPGDLVVTSYDPSWERPRLTAPDVMPLPGLNEVAWYVLIDFTDEFEATE